MKIRIIKESKKRLKKIEESIKDYTVAAGLSLGGMFGAEMHKLVSKGILVIL